jgi:hypothetical protein
MDRRQFLQTAISTGAIYSLSNLLPNFSLAQQVPEGAKDKLLLVLRFNGAWDTLMCMDGRSKEFLNKAAYTAEDFLSFDDRASAKEYKNSQFGVCMTPLFGYLDEICVVNGILMNQNSSSHETNREYMSSGNIASGSTFFPFALAEAMQRPDFKIGHRMEYEPLRDGGYPNKVHTSTLTSYTNPVIDPFEDILLDDSDAASVQKEIIMQKKKEQDVIKTLNELVKKTSEELKPDPTSENAEGFNQAAFALAGLGSGFLQMATVDMTKDGSLDAHFDHKVRHKKNLTEAFDHVAKIIKFMKATPYKLNPALNKSLFDVVTVVVCSEFSRTAAGEGGDGTGHNQYNNSCLLFGNGVKGGQVIGKSHIYKKSFMGNNGYYGQSRYQAVPFDFKTQLPMTGQAMAAATAEILGTCQPNSTCLDYIYPETIWRTMAQHFDVNSVGTLGTGPILKGLFKS